VICADTMLAAFADQKRRDRDPRDLAHAALR
jgi:hypothetical protein